MPLVTVEEFSKVLASVQLWFCRSIGIHLCVTAHWALLLQYACTLLSSPMADFSGGPHCSAGVRDTPALPPTHQLERDRFIILFGVCR